MTNPWLYQLLDQCFTWQGCCWSPQLFLWCHGEPAPRRPGGSWSYCPTPSEAWCGVRTCSRTTRGWAPWRWRTGSWTARQKMYHATAQDVVGRQGYSYWKSWVQYNNNIKRNFFQPSQFSYSSKADELIKYLGTARRSTISLKHQCVKKHPVISQNRLAGQLVLKAKLGES